jgi:hypothetical protein
MNLEFKEQVWKAQFKSTDESAAFEDNIRKAFGLQYRYEAARLLIGRSLAEPTAPDPLPSGTKFYNKPIPGEYLFGDYDDLWLCALIVDGKLSPTATVDDFRSLVEAHWARGHRLVKDELERSQGNEIRLVQRLSELLPEGGAQMDIGGDVPAGGIEGEVRLKIGSVSRTLDGDEPIDFILNGPGLPPHIALMGAIGKGKTMTGTQMAMELVQKARIPFIFIDPKGEFVEDGRVVGSFAALGSAVTGIEVGAAPIPLNFLPPHSAPTQRVARAAMRLRDTLAMCCKNPGDLQKDLLRTAIQDVINSRGDRSLDTIRDRYEAALLANGKSGTDSIISRLNEMTGSNMPCFEPVLQPAQFFTRSWVISLHLLPEELKRLVTLVILDAVSSFLLEQADSPVSGGYRVLRHLLVVDEARKTLRERRSESLVDLIRQGRSKGSVVMLLSQDPSDFEGEADDFTSQLGTVVAFACNQSKRGLGALEGVFGRKLQAAEFADTQLEAGVAFVKLPGASAQRIRCWQPST